MGKVLHASYSGFFPFCLKNQNTGATIPPDPLWYPSPPITIETAMRWYWRVKKWKIDVSHVIFVDQQETIFTDTKYVQHPNIGFLYLGEEAKITEEKKYVCGMSGLNIIGNNPDFDPGSGEDDFGCRIWFQSYPGKLDDWGIFRLPDPGDNRPIKEYDFYVALNFVFGEIGGVDLSGGNYQISINYPDSPDKIEMIFNDTRNFVKIYPEEYWSYGGTYDTATGAPLTET